MGLPTNISMNGAFLRPNDDIDPSKKSNDPSYCLDYSKYIYSQYLTDNSAIKSDMAERFVRNRSYAEGRQDTQQYKDWILGKTSDTPQIPVAGSDVDGGNNDLSIEDLGMENINFDDIFSPLPKYVENIIGIMRTQHHDITVNAVDENSGATREELKFGSLITAQLQPLILRFNSIFQLPDSQEQKVMPKSIEELELFDNIGAFKLPYEIAMEKAISHTFDISDFDKDLKDDVVSDFLVDGYSCVVTSQDITNGKLVAAHKDTLDIVLEDSKKANFSDSSWGGYIEYYTINKLRAETGWKEDRIMSIADKYKGEFGNPKVLDTAHENGQYNYDDYHIPILHSFWKAIDAEYSSERKTKNGPVAFDEPYRANGKPPKKRNGRQLDKVNIRRLYNAKWVLGSEDIFDYGIVTNTPFNFGNNDVEFPIRLYKIKGKPKIESMIPIEDQIYLTFIKTQNAIAKAAPPGLAVEWGSIKNISYGKKKLKPKDSIRLYTNTGNIVYQLDVKTMPGAQGSHRVGKPIEELRGGLGTAIADGISGIEFLYRQLDVISGIDGITSSTSTPSRDTGKAVTEMAMASTSNTLKPIYNGFIAIKESCSKVTAWQMQAIVGGYTVKDLEECPYFRTLGRSNLAAILAAGNYPPVVYGFSMEARSSDTEKQRMLEAASAGLQSGKNGIPAITFSEYSFVVRYLGSGRSIKYLELWMAKKEQERTVAEQQRAEQNMKVQAEQQRTTDAAKLAGDKEKYAFETQKEIDVIRVKGEEERLTLKEKFAGDRILQQDELRIKQMTESANVNQKG